MLSRSYRISVRQFNTIMEKGRVAHSPLFLVRVLSNMPDTRIAAVAPHKVIKTASARNSIRRKIYASVRTLNIHQVASTHILIFAKAALATSDSKTITTELKALFVKLGLLR